MVFYLILICHAFPGNTLAQKKPLVFTTWESFEVDKCASIWLIKKYVDPDAVIRFVPKGETIKEGIPFDTPEAQFRRYHNMSAFESLIKHYHLTDPALIYIGKIVHDIEVNIWEQKIYPETREVQDAILTIIQNAKSNEEVVAKSIEYFDRLATLSIRDH
jgi:hypothetical protein